jgi:cytochrome c oxidase cbb3-type subunit 3
MCRPRGRSGFSRVLADVEKTRLKPRVPASRKVNSIVSRTWAVLALQLAACVSLSAQPGPTGRQKVDPAAEERGRRVYFQFCINCHGSLARGTDDGPDLIRSVPVLKDLQGSELGPALKKAAKHKMDLSQAQIVDLSHFLKQRIEEASHNRNPAKSPNVLTGNVAAGREYFNGQGRCNTCHAPDGDLSGIGKRYDPVTLQQRFLFPRTGTRRVQPTQVTVTEASGLRTTGTLVHIDDFTIQIRDSSGDYRSWNRTPGMKVDLRDPYVAHNELLDRYTDGDMHNVVAYLETLQ